MLAIIDALSKYRLYVESLASPLSVLTNHSNLSAFTSKKVLNRQQARWANELSGMNFVITFRPRELNTQADALTQRPQDQEEGILAIAPEKTILPSEKIVYPRAIATSTLSEFESTFDLSTIRSTLLLDPFFKEIQLLLENPSNSAPRHPAIDLATCSIQNGLLLIQNLVYIPEGDIRRQVISSRHSHPAAGHPGVASTFELVTRDFWWPSIRKTIQQYIRNCSICSRIKPSRLPPFGFLKPLEISQKRWTSVSMDLITGLPPSNSFDAIIVFVDRLSKMSHFVPCNSTLDSKGWALLFRDNIFRLHGLPSDLVSDRGSIFISEFSKALCRLLGIKQNFSTANHPQSDGQTEAINALLEQYLRGYISY